VLGRGFTPGVAVMDKGYDGQPMHDQCESRGIRPVIAFIQTAAVKAGKHKPPVCEHRECAFAGSDAKRGASNAGAAHLAGLAARRPDHPRPACLRAARGQDIAQTASATRQQAGLRHARTAKYRPAPDTEPPG
jgi:hypothetical protein